MQARPGHCFKYLGRVGRYIARQRPEVIVQIGDFADLPSLSVYDKPGSKKHEGKRYVEDVAAAKRAMDALMSPIARASGYQPKLHLTLGNHEDRIDRAIEANPAGLEGVYSINQLGYKDYGWQVHPFLRGVKIGGVMFSHYFPSGQMGRPFATARAMVTGQNALHMSAMAGHQQGKQVATGRRADGSRITCIIAGSCYEHDEDYMPHLSNQHWRGIIFMHAVKDGQFDDMNVSLDFLKEKFK